MYPEQREDDIVASLHAIERWCERINTTLDKTNKEDRKKASKELVSAFKTHAKFKELQESGRRLYTYKQTRYVNGRKVVEEISIVVELDGKEIVTCWSNEELDDRILFEEEVSRWERQQRQRLWGRLFSA